MSINLLDSKYYINRELSWLEFNDRVLEEAHDRNNLLLERLRFLSISASNLDEYFMIRVSSLIDKVDSGYIIPDASGMTPLEQLQKISVKVHETVANQYNCLNRKLLPLLKKEGVYIARVKDLTPAQMDFITSYFYTTVFPILTPMAIDQSRPFPLLSNKALVFLVELLENGEKYFAVLQVPTVISRLITLPDDEGKSGVFILLEDIIRHFIGELFTGHSVYKCALFRITRNSDLEIDEEEAPDLLFEIEKSIKRRKWGKPVRLEIEKSMSKFSSDFLKNHLEMHEEEIYIISGILDTTVLSGVCNRAKGFAHLRNPEMRPVEPIDFIGKNIFEAIKEKDILVHHPYESFDCVVSFIEAAANDPDVLAIKQTLYRVSGNSPIVKALMKAAENGKQVTVLVELKARFDEENNIIWAKQLERSGCHVIYGLVGLKIHCKACFVVRREEDGIKRYVHLSTGNYNDATANLYTDVGLFTCKESFGRDISALFNSLTGYSAIDYWNKISVAPASLRSMFLTEIYRETQNALQGKRAIIVAKMNSLVDEKIISALYEASIAGVKIKLIVRGICCLRPGMDEVSKNITVYSIVGRYLEHSRIYYFENDGQPKIYLSSADWMPRNLDSRVEIAFPIEEESLKGELTIILSTILADTVKLRIQQSDGSYIRADKRGRNPLNSQDAFTQMAIERLSNKIGQSLRKNEPNGKVGLGLYL